MKWLLLAVLAGCVTVSAQTTSGSITGTIVDASASAVGAADVTLISDATALKRETKTSPAGSFEFNVLEPGVYNISVSAAGFRGERFNTISLTAKSGARWELSR